MALTATSIAPEATLALKDRPLQQDAEALLEGEVKREDDAADEIFSNEDKISRGYQQILLGTFASFQSIDDVRLSMSLSQRERSERSGVVFKDEHYQEDTNDTGNIILAWIRKTREQNFQKHDVDAVTATTVEGSNRSLTPAENECTTLNTVHKTTSVQDHLSQVLDMVTSFVQDRITTFTRNILHLKSKAKDPSTDTFKRNIQVLRRSSKEPGTDTFKRNIELLKKTASERFATNTNGPNPNSHWLCIIEIQDDDGPQHRHFHEK